MFNLTLTKMGSNTENGHGITLILGGWHFEFEGGAMRYQSIGEYDSRALSKNET